MTTQLFLHIINLHEIKNTLANIEIHINELDVVENKRLLLSELQKVKTKLHTNQIDRGKRRTSQHPDDEDRTNIGNHIQSIEQNNHNIIEGSNDNIRVNNHFNETIRTFTKTIETDRVRMLG